MKLKKGDTVKILAGKDKGKTGKIVRIIPDKNKLVVEGLNVYKKHVRPKREEESGEIIDVSRPMDASNVGLVCPSCSEATRVGYQKREDSKSRYCKKCDSIISN